MTINTRFPAATLAASITILSATASAQNAEPVRETITPAFAQRFPTFLARPSRRSSSITRPVRSPYPTVMDRPLS